ncbi:MAG: hypothetical protein WA364_24375 [Candidatus Nitrosopolaris sp.]
MLIAVGVRIIILKVKELLLTWHLMTQINFRLLFGILFTTFIFILVFIFAIIAITEKLTITSASILIIIPLAIRYAVYSLTKI